MARGGKASLGAHAALSLALVVAACGVAGWGVVGCERAAPRETAAAADTSRVFESHWQDGRAELAGYRYHVTRYGQRREGRCAMITVTEPFSASKHVKADHSSQNSADTFEALKMNLVRHFQTGIYDYHTMISIFTKSRDFSTDKVAFTCAEWCGQVYEELIFEKSAVTGMIRSYFEDESRELRLPAQGGGIPEDDLFILLRGLRGDYLPPGGSRSAPFLPSPFHCRLTHQPTYWTSAAISRSRDLEQVQVPAGSFQAIAYTVRVKDGRTGQFWIESAYPHRILRWSWAAPASDGGRRMSGDGSDEGELIRSTRLPYWRLNQEGDESHLSEMGLPPGR